MKTDKEIDMLLDVKQKLKICYILYQNYVQIIDSYVSDYYVENHWSKLPRNWQVCLENISGDQIANLLDFKKSVTNGIFPLSLLCIRTIIVSIMTPRSKLSMISNKQEQDEHFLKYFWKNVKLKKRHEIEKMAQYCFETATKSNCFYIVDIGSGLGHLSRMLSYGYGFKVCTFEANSTLSNLAKDFDLKFEKILKSKHLNDKHVQRTIHINKKIEHDMDWKYFLDIVTAAFCKKGDEFKFGIVGLHPCGNLGSTLLRLYNDCPNAVFINMASCCYMKLTLEPVIDAHFPLSDFCKNNNFKLSYLACEIACHAIENYVEKLRQEADCAKLKIHAYRASLEQILVSIDSNFKHSAVCNIKYTESLTFKKYCDKICSKLSVVPSEHMISVCDSLINQTWKNIIVFYSLRLLFAPLIETIILFDRLLYTADFNTTSEIVPLFDCNISPRNHVLSCRKCHSE